MKRLNKKYLKDVGKYDFGSYQRLVESVVYEVENIKNKLAESVQKRFNTYRNKRIRLLMYLSAFALIPIVVFIQLIIDKGNFLQLFLSGWLLISGVSLFCMHYKAQDKVWFGSKADSNLEIKVVQIVLNYALVTIEDYYNKAEFADINGKVLSVLQGSNIDALVDKLYELEVDLHVFDEIAGNNYRNNKAPIILDPNTYMEKREESQAYILGYIKDQISEINKYGNTP